MASQSIRVVFNESSLQTLGHMVTHQLILSQAIANFIHYKEAIGRSEHTSADCHSTRKKLLEFFADDQSFAAITRAQLIHFFAWLTKEYVSDPDGVAPRGKFSSCFFARQSKYLSHCHTAS
jgi:hypothetical protein